MPTSAGMMSPQRHGSIKHDDLQMVIQCISIRVPEFAAPTIQSPREAYQESPLVELAPCSGIDAYPSEPGRTLA